MEKRNRSVTVAIDFGTTFSGFGFAEANVLGEAGIQVFRGWGRGQGFSFYKTPTCVLLNPDGSFSKFGHAAVETYTKHLAKGSNKDFIYFERFKLVLYNTKVKQELMLFISRARVYASAVSRRICPILFSFLADTKSVLPLSRARNQTIKQSTVLSLWLKS